MIIRKAAAIGDLVGLGARRAAEAEVVSAAVDYVRDREGRWGSAAARYRKLRAAARALMRARRTGQQA